MTFQQPLLYPIDDKYFRLAVPYIYEWKHEGYDLRIKIPVIIKVDGDKIVYFETDKASVPRLVWSFTGILPDGLHVAAAVIHDALYQYRGNLPEGWFQYLHTQNGWVDVPIPYHNWTREQADKMFCRLIREAHEAAEGGEKTAGKIKRNMMFWAVRMFGGRYWNS